MNGCDHIRIRYKTDNGLAERDDVVHVVPLHTPGVVGVLFKNGDSNVIEWNNILGIYAK